METASWASTPGVARSMRSNRRRDTRPEIALRSVLHRRGRRFRIDVAIAPLLRRRADIVFPRQRVAVFVDGCFWHGCPEHATAPKRNADYWSAKFARNRARDVETTAVLEAHGWTVLRVWEHVPPGTAADAVEAALRARRPAT